MHAKRPCQQQILARQGDLLVSWCDHGTAHVTLGDVTLRLDEDKLLALAAVLGSAAELLERGATRVARPLRLHS